MNFAEEIIITLSCPGIEARLLGCPTPSVVTISTELFPLQQFVEWLSQDNFRSWSNFYLTLSFGEGSR
jgi:hypothetical protein